MNKGPRQYVHSGGWMSSAYVCQLDKHLLVMLHACECFRCAASLPNLISFGVGVSNVWIAHRQGTTAHLGLSSFLAGMIAAS